MLPANQAINDYKNAKELFDQTEPLENVLDYYGGNSEKMFNHLDHDGGLEKSNDVDNKSKYKNLNALKKINKNMKGNLCVAPRSF